MLIDFKDFITEKVANERVVVKNKEASDLEKSKKGGSEKDSVVPGAKQSKKNHDVQQKADEDRARTAADIEDGVDDNDDKDDKDDE